MFIFQISLLFLALTVSHSTFIEYCHKFHNFTFFMYLFVISIICLFCKSKNNGFKSNADLKDILLLCSVFSINFINTIFLKSEILQGITFVAGTFGIINLFTDLKYKNRLFWLCLVFILRLPVKDLFQIFLGVPCRLTGAKVLENLFHLLHINSINQSSILIFENSVSNIEYSCSGSSAIYYTLIFICLISFLKSASINLKNIIYALLSIILAIFLNIVRIFILIILSLNRFSAPVGDKIHACLGIINFVIILLFFLFLTKNNDVKEQKILKLNDKIINSAVIFILLISVFTPLNPFKNLPKTDFEIIKNPQYKNLDLSDSEKFLYGKYGGKIEKYNDGEKIVIKIISNSWKSFHNPELCLKNQGFKIIESKTLYNKNRFYKMLFTDKGYVYYYFSNNKKYIEDYYKAVFFSIFGKNKNWSMNIIYSPILINNIFDE